MRMLSRAKRVVGVALVALLACLPCVVLAQDEAGGDAPTVAGTATVEELTDFRSYLMFGFSLVFVLIIGYLVVSQRRNAALAEEAEFLKKRIDELGK
ncbi:MAG: hypothetical protein AAF581_02825 [Planctomycetota bacterium]